MAEWLVPFGYGEDEFTEKKSRFIGRVWHIESEQDALEHIRKVGEIDADAKHNVYCYALREGNIIRCTDNGEPQGTAGQPALAVFQKAGVTDFCCVITRYFGGILLGAGGLIRAYGHAAKIGLDAAGIAAMRPWKSFVTAVDYGMYDRMLNELAPYEPVIDNTEFGTDVTIEFSIRNECVGEVAEMIREMTAGKAELIELGESFRPVRL